jgi:hypothetical protein
MAVSIMTCKNGTYRTRLVSDEELCNARENQHKRKKRLSKETTVLAVWWVASRQTFIQIALTSLMNSLQRPSVFIYELSA